MINFNGNGTKSLRISVNNSLKNLQTDYIDLVGLPPTYQSRLTIPDIESSMFIGGTTLPTFLS